MFSSLYIGASGMLGQQTNMDVISNNIANTNTNGFKSARSSFSDLLYQSYPTGFQDEVQLGSGVRVDATNRSFSQGVITQTGSAFDLAVEGDGFFTIELPDGRFAYTRDGHFTMDAQGRLVNADGGFLYPRIDVPEGTGQVNIAATGEVTSAANSGAITVLGKIQTVVFPNSEGLQAAGDNLFIETANSGRPVLGNPGDDGRGKVLQGFLERSNVSVAEEMVNMILTQRAFEMNSKVVQTTDAMLGTAVNMRA